MSDRKEWEEYIAKYMKILENMPMFQINYEEHMNIIKKIDSKGILKQYYPQKVIVDNRKVFLLVFLCYAIPCFYCLIIYLCIIYI